MKNSMPCNAPLGAKENSPAIYRRERNDKFFFVPSGRLIHGNQASLRDAIDFSPVFQALKCLAIFKCPFRTLNSLNRRIHESFPLKLARMAPTPDLQRFRKPKEKPSLKGWIDSAFSSHRDLPGLCASAVKKKVSPQ